MYTYTMNEITVSQNQVLTASETAKFLSGIEFTVLPKTGAFFKATSADMDDSDGDFTVKICIKNEYKNDGVLDCYLVGKDVDIHFSK